MADDGNESEISNFAVIAEIYVTKMRCVSYQFFLKYESDSY